MSSQTSMFLMNLTEFALWVVLGLLFWAKQLHRKFPAMSRYLTLRVAAGPLLFALLCASSIRQTFFFQATYFIVYWVVYIASAVLLYFICIEIFSSALSTFTGLQKLGTVVFRWAALASAILGLSTLSIKQLSFFIVTDVAYRLMRTVSILELSLLAFLCVSMNALRLPLRDRTFGVALSLGLTSASDFFVASFMSRNTSLTDPLQFVSEAVVLVALGIWITYVALPEPARAPVMMPARSLIYRWNEIAAALGHTETKVAVQPQATSFFLNDVEQVVDRVFAKNMERGESES